MKRALELRTACVMLGTAFLLFGCGGQNPVLPPEPTPLDGDIGGRGLATVPDAEVPVVAEAGAGKNVVDAPRNIDVSGDAPEVAGGSVAPTISVTILSPLGALSPDGGTVEAPVVAKASRFAPQVRVEVQSQGSDAIGDVLASVRASLFSVQSKATVVDASLNQTQYNIVPESSTKIYLYMDTPLDLSGVSGGLYDLQVAATTAGGTSASATVRIFVDAGPAITFLQPAAAAYVKGSVVVTAIVTDANSGIVSVGISIGQYQLAASAITSNGAQYTATVDFGSYNPPLDGDQIITVTSTNGNGVTSLSTRKFTIDNVGPAITDTLPATGHLIGKIITIAANVADPAGVMDSSVIAVVANGDVHFEVALSKGTDGVYRQLFDTSQLPIYAIFPSISFRAQDVLGNQSSVGYLVSLDNTPPLMDLDPPAHFQLIRKDGTCSWPFDPVGPDAIDDGSIVTQLFDIRARVEDQGNTALTGTPDWVPISAVDPATVKVLILDDNSLPLVVDTSDPPDGICDDINPELVPSTDPQTSKDAQLIDMVSLPANSGLGDFTHQPGSYCSGADTSSPPAFCDTTYSALKNQVMTYSLGYSSNLPSIWAVAPVVSDGYQCAGRQFDASNNLHDGWACVAVEASDMLGNKQVSRPIRICVAAQPGSTACTAAAMGGADLTSVTLPASAAGNILITTQAPLVGAGGVAIKQGDTLVLSKVTPALLAAIDGTHVVNPQDTSGVSFAITDLTMAPLALSVDNLDGSALAFKGNVGVVMQNGAEIHIITDSTTALDSGFLGKVVVSNLGLASGLGAAEWSVNSIQPTGFNLTNSTLKLSGGAVPWSMLPNCTGTVLKQAAGVPVKVDATKPCKPWLSYPQYEARMLNQ
jgi:hypothetical protein